MNVLVIGGAGYLGSVLIPKLLVRGHKVRVLDVGYFGVSHLRSLEVPIELIREDVRRICSDREFREEIISGCDCIIHLAAISNDPSAELYPELTDEINFQVTKVLAEVACTKGIRFIFSSSCSVYGEVRDEVDEEGPVNPLTIYAESKVKSEHAIKELVSDKWSPVILRNGTLFGYSRRMRFDLLVNIFSLDSSLYNEIKIFGEGQEWRPFLHVADCARAFVYFAENQRPRYHCYNISGENLRVTDVAGIFKKIKPSLKITFLKNQVPDSRDYRVSTRRIQEEGFSTHFTVEMGAEEMIDAIISGLIQDPEAIYYRNAKWLKELTHMGEKSHKEIVTFIDMLSQMHLNHQLK